MGLPIAVPIVGGLLVAAGVGLRLNKLSKESKSTKLPGVVTSGTVPNSKLQDLPIQVQEILSTRGAPVDQNFLNAIQQNLAAGEKITAQNTMKATDGSVFTPEIVTPTVFPSGVMNPGDIIATDRITVDVSKVPFKIPGIPSGNAIFSVTSIVSNNLVMAKPIDPRTPDNQAPVQIPVVSITGIGPA